MSEPYKVFDISTGNPLSPDSIWYDASLQRLRENRAAPTERANTLATLIRHRLAQYALLCLERIAGDGELQPDLGFELAAPTA
jgi:hypothetical protein